MPAMSYVCGTSDRPLVHITVGELLAQAADRWRDRPALIVRHQGVRWTYGELLQASDRFAAGLIELGLEPGDRVGIWAPNGVEWVVTQFATARAGLILVNVNPAYRSYELEHALRQVGCKALVFSPALRSIDGTAVIRELAPECDSTRPGELRAARLPDLRSLVCIGASPAGMFSFEEVCRAGAATGQHELARRRLLLDPDDPINVQFTSGTTGLPKGATLTHFNIVNNGYSVGERLRLGPEDILCIPVPLYHCFGMVLGVLACVAHGSAMVFPGEYFDAGEVLDAVSAERCTALHGVPTMFIAELDHPEFARYDLSSLRTGIMAGSPCPVEVMKRVVERMHMREVTICYGMTETSPVSFQTEVSDPLKRRVTTVGRVHPHVQVKVVDAEGRLVPRGVQGELLTRGYSVMRGYWGDPEQTAQAVDAAGWMHTGDLATIDEAGYCNIVGRVKDLIIRGGENISPREIEELLYTHPAVADAAVFGVPDARYGEAVCAWVRLRPGSSPSADDLRDYCAERIARFKIPRHVRFVEELPMTVTGKLQKYRMRDAMRRELGASEAQTA